MPDCLCVPACGPWLYQSREPDLRTIGATRRARLVLLQERMSMRCPQVRQRILTAFG